MLLGLLAPLLAQVATQGEVIVTARRLPVKPIRDAIGYFERHCFDASRFTGQPSAPRHDTDWRPLTPRERTTYGLGGKAGPAFVTELTSGQVVALILPDAMSERDLTTQRCTMIVTGGQHRAFAAGLSRMIGGPGTQRHVGDQSGVRRMDGWRQEAWTAAPTIGSKQWRAYPTRQAGGSWLVVTDPSFYDDRNYVAVELKSRVGGEALSIVTLSYTYRRRPV